MAPLNCVVDANRVSSATNRSHSDFNVARSAVVLVSLAAWTANSRSRPSTFVKTLNAPSAVFTNDVASDTFRTAWFRPRAWKFSLSAMANPAGSSAARFTRRPDESRSRDLCNWSLLRPKLRWAVKLEMFVLMIRDIEILLDC